MDYILVDEFTKLGVPSYAFYHQRFSIQHYAIQESSPICLIVPNVSITVCQESTITE